MSEKQAQAVLYGLALGDALGWPTEFVKLTEIKRRYGAQGIQAPPDSALFTDDTQMTIALTEGLLEAGLDADIDTQMKFVGKWFIEWMQSEENNRAPGNACLKGVERYQTGLPWRESGIIESKGCGSAMRVATIGYLYQNDEIRLREIAEASGVITHRHPAAIAASLAGAYLVKLALDGVSPDEYIRRVMSFADGISAEFDATLLRVGHVMGWADEEAALDHIGQGWTGEEAIALAIYCVLRYPDDYVACVRRAANTNGDSDSIACIVGGIMGARLGLEAIPADWRTRCEKRDYLADLGDRMAKAREALLEMGIDRSALREYCLAKKGVAEEFPFGEEVAVFKVMGKMFTLISVDDPLKISLKCDPTLAEILRQTHAAVKPGWFKKTWNSVEIDGSITDDEILDMIDHSYTMVVKGLTKKERATLEEMGT